MARPARPGRRARRRKGELAHRIRTSRTITDAYIAAAKLYVELDGVPRWRWRKRALLAADVRLACAEADALIETTLGRPPATPLLEIFRRRPWEDTLRDSRRAPSE